jgi:UDP-glucose 4-epimerase
MDIWVIGARGLLGSALVRALPAQVRVFRADPVPWASPVDSSRALLSSLAEFRRWRRDDRPWGIVWAAGSGVIASPPEQLRLESRIMLDFAAEVASTPEEGGAYLFASSASVFGNSSGLAADEATLPVPTNDYARAKLDQERSLTDLFGGSTSLLLARIGTLYGPGQNPRKPQGLISAMCRESVFRRTISIFVPIDTTRDYLYVDDAARQCLHLLGEAVGQPPQTRLRVVASHRTTTIGEVARLVQAVSHHRAPILQVPGAAAAGHARHLALTSQDPVLRAFPTTPLPVGIHAVYQDTLRQVMAGTH